MQDLSNILINMPIIDQVTIILIVFLTSFLIFSVVRRVVINRLKKTAPTTESTFDDMLLEASKIWNEKVIGIFSVLVVLQFVNVAESLSRVIDVAGVLILAFFLTKSINLVLKFWLTTYIDVVKKSDPEFDPAILVFGRHLLGTLLWMIVLLLLLQNYGFNVTALIGGLGIGGLAVAFAVQNILADLFSSISIYFDKPFTVGDFIEVGKDSGTVTKIGLKSTRLQTVRGDELVISNKDLTGNSIHNLGKTTSRRVIPNITLDPNKVTAKKVDEIIELLIKAVDSVAEVERDIVTFRSISKLGYVFEYSYLVKNRNFAFFLQKNKEVNVAVMTALEAAKIPIVFAEGVLVEGN